ncbi:hypothetical protein KO506_02690 [Polaribacter vadi]|uniref:hypothetical protein n=1 Tax=Polaribacter TaxID=52959 RepID=UPI001C092E13|nr:MULTISPECIES: hypothetical protein [Polaribacter]MBU3010299.1 hypothetical protein [Polaribacter vadi]MDO6740106.1 hypothetical protein [Polaribacter sp. 1_MG-2023]
MKKALYYFLIIIGSFSILVGLFSLVKGGDFKAYFYSIFIGVVLIGTTYYNRQQKQKK